MPAIDPGGERVGGGRRETEPAVCIASLFSLFLAHISFVSSSRSLSHSRLGVAFPYDVQSTHPTSPLPSSSLPRPCAQSLQDLEYPPSKRTHVRKRTGSAFTQDTTEAPPPPPPSLLPLAFTPLVQMTALVSALGEVVGPSSPFPRPLPLSSWPSPCVSRVVDDVRGVIVAFCVAPQYCVLSFRAPFVLCVLLLLLLLPDIIVEMVRATRACTLRLLM